MTNISNLVSIIIPIYNVEQYLSECIESIIHQTYKNIEILLIDDGSVDKSPEICEHYASLDDRVKVIHKVNNGLSEARNTGIENCKGDFIIFVDGDDFIDQHIVEKLLLGHSIHKSDIEVCKFYSLENGNISEFDEIGNKIKDSLEYISGLEYLKYYIGGLIENSVCCKLFKKECFELTKFRKGRNNEDFLIFYDLCKHNITMGFTHYFGYYYRQREGSIIHDENTFLYYDIMLNIAEMRTYIKKEFPDLIPSLKNKEIQERIIFMKTVLKKHILFKHIKEIYKCYFSLIRQPPFYFKELPINFRKPFIILKFAPFLYLFRK